MTEDENMTVDYYTNIDESSAYQAIYESGRLAFETFSSSNGDFLIHVDNKRKTYNKCYLKVYRRSDSPYIPLKERIVFDDITGDDLPTYCYRANITNCFLAS